MTPEPGEVYLVDLGYEGKVRPVVVVSRADPNAPRALCTAVPLTTQNRGSRYEVPMPKVGWLKHTSFANVQGIATYGHHELVEKRGRFDPGTLRTIKEAIRWALDL
jgi:mRNA interferase MazF